MSDKESLRKNSQTENLLQQLQEKNPKKNVLFTAIDELTEEVDIKNFFEQYVQSLSMSIQESPEQVAASNIGYAVGYYNKQTAGKWMKALPKISHSIFGKNIPFDNPEKAFSVGTQAARTEFSDAPQE